MMLVDDVVTDRRKAAIARLGVIDRAGDPKLTGLCRIAAYVAGAGAAAVHILDDELQRRVASVNAQLGAHPRSDSMCHLVVDSEERIVCADASEDDRFGYSSFVHGPDPVRLYVSVPLRTSEGIVIGTLCAFDTVAAEVSAEQVKLMEDLAEQVSGQIELRVAAELAQFASHDMLTGAVHRLVLSDRLSQVSARQTRHGGQILLAVVDVENFRRINDFHGHAVGDEVLIAVAQRMMAAVRAEDTVARVGPDEFVVLAEIDDSPAAATALLGRIEGALSEPIELAGQPRQVAASIGTAIVAPGEDVRSALRRADAAMYDRKPLVAH
jgi:diguanylate cyclase (GGDEF)-like protein